jgi:energy-coupling factor transporter ATP-binding protein EcfA2
LHLDYDNFPGDTKQAKLRALLDHLDKRHRFDDLLGWLQENRSDQNWSQFQPQFDPDGPYRGLQAFRPEHAKYYFGRETFVAQLRQVVPNQRLIPVLGPSGSGKSSVVLAGLLPHLQADPRWLIATLRPGNTPFLNLSAALLPHYEEQLTETGRLVESKRLADALQDGTLTLPDVVARIATKQPDGHHFLLVIDQFEELYTLNEPATRHPFLDQLIALSQAPPAPLPSHTLLTLRADFLGQALAYTPFADLLNSQPDIKLRPLTTDELERVIVEPAKVAGASFAEGLVGRILQDVGDEPGNLPLLQFALTLLWERQENGVLTHAAYEALDGVGGALAHYADEVLAELSEAEQEQVRRVFIQLVQPGAGAEDTRRLANRHELTQVNWAVVDKLATKRLIVTNRATLPDMAEGSDTIEVTHEALIQRWGRLQQWLEEDRDFRVWQERLRGAMQEWQLRGQEGEALLRGAALAEAMEWQASRATELSAGGKSVYGRQPASAPAEPPTAQRPFCGGDCHGCFDGYSGWI